MLRLKKYAKKPNTAEEVKNSNVKTPVDGNVEKLADGAAANNNKTSSYESFSKDIIGELSHEEDN